jgi:hypothetical protein
MDGNGTLSYLNDLWRLHMPSMTWEFLGGSTVGNSDGGAHWPAARSYAPYAFDESTSSFYIFSGRGGSKDKYLQDLWRLDTRNFTWTRLGEHSPQPIRGGGRTFGPCRLGSTSKEAKLTRALGR